MKQTMSVAIRAIIRKRGPAAAAILSLIGGGAAFGQEFSMSGPPSGGAIDKSGDEALQALIQDVAPDFKQLEYMDEETGLTLPYNLFVPEGVSEGEALPLVYFIADASVVGQQVTAPLEQGYGGLIWASDAMQDEHPAIVLVPEFPEVIIDDHDGFQRSDYVGVAERLVRSVAADQGADTDRIYATGQSMGCMTLMYLSAENPDLFAAEMFVSGQWDPAELTGLADETFFYIVAAGDPKASAGQAELRTALQTDGVSVSSAEWDADWSQEELSQATEELVSQGSRLNFVTFTEGSVMPEGVATPENAGEHMYSFDPAYRIDAVRDWLFAQSK
ncbi:hypothetical protein [Paracoccus sediminicola]|uniref:carboxylesterase family protein n=1 Tax=Paracoccus sediminicola TaxID=3017783 RepID=UPI0022F00316|nr:hypothetical protein [Paracoccus sediminicola]WBU57565.1 hypothetical protein PAF18_03750 [Paracoccus sediminicola]